MSRTPSLQELMVASFESQMSNIYTTIPCIVLAVDLEKSTADIQPSINQRLPDGTVAERPVIMGVPISFQASNTAAFTFPISVGDTGTAIFSMRDMEGWLTGNGRPTTPLNDGRMDKNDAIFLPGIQPPSMTINNPVTRVLPHNVHDAVIVNNIGTSDEVEVRLKASGDIVINAPTKDVTVNCKTSTVNASQSLTLDSPDISLFGNITHNGNWTGVGTYSFNGIIFGTHKHGISPGPSN